MMMFGQILFGVMLAGMLIMMFMRYGDVVRNTPDAKEGDWAAAILPLVAVVGFVLLLMWLV